MYEYTCTYLSKIQCSYSYFYKATQGVEAFNLPRSDLQTTTTQNDLLHWRRIVIFYTLRLMFAPLIESIILYDRALYLQENGEF